MLNLTRQERFVVCFLIAFFIIGGIIHLYNTKFSSKPALSNVDSIKSNLVDRVERNDSLYFPESEKTVQPEIEKSQEININTATKTQLMQIRGIGPVTAERIIEYRESEGIIKSIQELTNIKGIGIKTVEKIKNEVTIE
jgi:competence protein ComEA